MDGSNADGVKLVGKGYDSTPELPTNIGLIRLN